MNTLLTQLYPALLKQSAFLLARFPSPSLQPEDLLHKAVERMLHRPPSPKMNDTCMLRGLVVTIMRRVLVDEWRRNASARRGHGACARPLEEAGQVAATEADTWPEVAEALAALRSELPEAAEVVEMRFFQGVPQCEVARTLAVSPATVSRRWHAAAAWLRTALAPSHHSPLSSAA